MKDYTTANRQAVKIALIYLVISGAWIAAGDWLIGQLPDDLNIVTLISAYESWLVILLTTGFIFFIVRSGYRSFIRNRGANLHKISRNLKRDLTVLAKVIDLRVRQLGSRGSAAALKITQFRIQTLSVIYDLLLKNGNTRGLSFPKVADHLKNDNFDGLDLHCDELHLSATRAVTLGLLLNEVITPFVPDNGEETYPLSVAIKNGQNSTVSVVFRLVEAPEYLINQIQDKENSLEGRIINTLTRKLGGAPSWKQSNGHLKYQIQFNK